MKNEIRQDGLKFYFTPVLVRIFSDFSGLALPTVTAMLIGGMTDSLLALNMTAITAQLIPFCLAMVLSVLLVPLLGLWENILLTKRGFSYDTFLMGRFMRKPLADIQQIDSGTVTQRLMEDSISFSFHLLWIYSRPVILLGYVGVLTCLVVFGGYHWGYCLILVLLSGSKLLRSSLRSKQKAVLKRKVSEYSESRRTLQQELGDAKDFVRSFRLENFTLNRFKQKFYQYESTTGNEKSCFDAWEAVLDFLCSYGVELMAVLLGTAFVVRGQLTLGAVLGGYLLLPAISQAWEFGAELVSALREEPETVSRLTIFYGERESEVGEPVSEIIGHGVSFRYPGSDRDILCNVDFSVSSTESQTFSGENGSGKSTLLSLIAGLYPPAFGTITDKSGKPLSLASRKQSVSLLEQEGTIFSGTVAENLFSGDSCRAAKLLAQLSFEKSIDYTVEPEGKNLSPGERKKLLIARALLKEAPILALDEPLNHLDSIGEHALHDLLRDREGILMISHRPFEKETVSCNE